MTGDTGPLKVGRGPAVRQALLGNRGSGTQARRGIPGNLRDTRGLRATNGAPARTRHGRGWITRVRRSNGEGPPDGVRLSQCLEGHSRKGG